MSQELKLGGEAVLVPVEEMRQELNYGLPYNTQRHSAQTEETSYWTALKDIQTPTKVGASLAIYGDKFLRSLDKNDTMNMVDPMFDPRQVWKDSGLSEDDFPTISKMTNFEQYNTFKEYRDWRDNTEQALEGSGVTGAIVEFGSQLLTDPTTYFGFGAAKMLSKGMSAAKALAISGAASGAVYEGIQQATDIGEQRTAAQSMITIGSSGVIGGVLGAATPLFTKFVSKKGKDFSTAAVDVINNIDDIEANTYKSLSAMAVNKDPSLSEISGTLPRFLAKGYSYLSPKIKGQASETPEVREAFAKFYGTSLTTKGNVEGIATEASFVDSVVNLNKKAKGMMNDMADTVVKLEKQGVKVDDDFYRRVFIKANDFEDQLIDGTPESLVAKKMLEMGEFIKKEADGMDGFNIRERFIPSSYSEKNVNMNFPALQDKMVKFIKNEISGIDGAILKLNNKIERLSNDASSLAKQKIDDLSEELNRLQAYRSMGDSEIAEEAYHLAERFRTGNFNEALMAFRPIGAKKVMPSHFKERLLEQKDMVDFLEVNPFELYSKYYRDVIPHVSSHQVFGRSTPEKFINNYADKLRQKLPKITDAKEKIKLGKEIDMIEKDLSRGWQNASGGLAVMAKDYMGDTAYNIAKAAKNWTSAVSLGTSIFANTTEFAATSMVHGLKEQKELTAIMAKAASSPELRNMMRGDAKYMANVMTLVAHSKTAKAFTDDYINYGFGKNSLTGKLSKGASFVNHWSQYANGNVPWTGFIRDFIQLSRQNAIIESVSLLNKGKLTGERLTSLSKLGIGKEHSSIILEQIKKHAKDVDGVLFANTQEWDDTIAKRIMENAINRDVRSISIDPQVGDTPHIFNVAGFDLLFQFKSWAVTAGHTYGLAALQRADQEHLVGMASYIGWGALTYMIAEKAKGNEPPTDIDEILYAGVSNSGVLGVLPDYGGHYFANRWLDLDSGGAKYSEYQDWKSLIEGPAMGKVKDFQGVATPFIRALDPDKEAEFNNKFWKDFMDILPVPYVKPYIKNELLK